MPAKRQGVYWLPLGGDQDNFVASLASRAGATKLIPIQDPIDSVNLRGTIVGGTIEVFVNDGGQNATLPPELIVGVWPAAVTPIGYTTAAMKEQEEYIWIRQLMDPSYYHEAASSANGWKATIRLTTKRRVAQRGERLGLGILNHDASAMGAGAAAEWMLDLYMVLDA